VQFVDIHFHIIPGVDDGPKDFEASMAMASQAAADGTAAIIATPHVVEGGYDGADREARIADLKMSLAGYGIEMKILSGAEVPLSMCLGGDREALGRLTLAGSRYLLMETAETTFEQLAKAVYQVRLSGYYPILAHPERAAFVSENPKRLAAVTASGDVFCQLTTASVEGRLGKRLRRVSQAMLEQGLGHLVASDAHSHQNRPPGLSKSYEVVERIMGVKAARIIMLENPQKVLRNEPLASAGPGTGKRTGFMSRMLRRY